MNNLCIDVKNLNKHFGEHHVVKDFSLQVAKGEIYGFLGPNGSGKTTSIRMMCGLITPDSGEGTCLGMDIFTQREKIKKKIGYMTQYFSMWGNLTIRENLLFIARLYSLDQRRDRVERALSELGLTARQHQLSDRGISILVSTHYMDEAERCHKVAYLSYGRLLANGTIASIIASQNLITMRTSGAGLTLLESQLQRLPDIEQTVIFGNQLYITSRDEAKLKSALFAFTQQGYEFCKVDTNLEDAFTYLMKNNCEKN
ncbi:ABC transporter ATP-binding protein [Klebsiella pneumoniae]